MKFNVTDVEFDFDDDYANGFKLTLDEEIELIYQQYPLLFHQQNEIVFQTGHQLM